MQVVQNKLLIHKQSKFQEIAAHMLVSTLLQINFNSLTLACIFPFYLTLWILLLIITQNRGH
jgi:hypothetical protein